MHLRPYVPALLVVIAGVGAWHWRRQAIPAPSSSVSVPAVSAVAPAFEVGSGRPESDRAPTTVHGGLARRHRAVGRGPTTARVLWRRELGSPIEAQITASNDGLTLYAVTLGGDAIALSAATGEELWRRNQGSRVYSAPTVLADGSLVFGRDGGAIVALTAAGAPRFRFETEQDCDVSVVEHGGALLTACGQRLLALQPNGTLRAEALLAKKSFTTPAVFDDHVVVGSQDGHVRSFRAATLTLEWDTALGADVDGGVAIGDDGAIYVGTDAGEVARLDARGTIVWRQKVGNFVRGPLSVARNGDVLAGAMGAEPAQVRLRGDSGAVVFRARTRGTGALEFGIRGGALEDDAGNLYFGAQDDAVYALAGDGTPWFRFETGGDVDAPLTLLTDGKLLVASDDGSVTCLAP